MDFSNRGSQQSPAAPRPGATFSADSSDAGPKTSSKGMKRPVRKTSNLMVGIGAIVVGVLAALILILWFSQKVPAESGYVNKDKLQAVFLANDQVYFGNISTLNSRYLVLTNIYYLQSQNNTATSTTANSNVSLVKLGCELHRPYDQMIINRSEVEFWENLQSGGQVANAVAQYQKANPTGQKCSTTTANGASTSTVQGSPSSSTTDTGTSTGTSSGTNSGSSSTTTKP